HLVGWRRRGAGRNLSRDGGTGRNRVSRERTAADLPDVRFDVGAGGPLARHDAGCRPARRAGDPARCDAGGGEAVATGTNRRDCCGIRPGPQSVGDHLVDRWYARADRAARWRVLPRVTLSRRDLLALGAMLP